MEEAEAIIALSAKVKEMTRNNLKLAKQFKDKINGGNKKDLEVELMGAPRRRPIIKVAVD